MMDEPNKTSTQQIDVTNVLPDVVHSQQIPSLSTDLVNVTEQNSECNVCLESESNEYKNEDIIEVSETESISEHVPSKMDYSMSDSDMLPHSKHSSLDHQKHKTSADESLNIPPPHSPLENHPTSLLEVSRISSSWPLEVNVPNVHISDESPVNLASSEQTNEDLIETPKQTLVIQANELKNSNKITLDGEFSDSLDTEDVQKSDGSQNLDDNQSQDNDKKSSSSEEIIKLDIRGQGAPKFPLPRAKIIFGPPPVGGTIVEPNIKPLPTFPNLMSPFLVSTGDSIRLEDICVDSKVHSENNKENVELSVTKLEQNDLLVEELTVDESKEKEQLENEEDLVDVPKSSLPEEMSFSTLTTDYKTICEEYHTKLVHLEDAISQRDTLIEELTISLQHSAEESDRLKAENEHLSQELQCLQHIVAERSEHDTVKCQLSDFMKYENMVNNDSSRFYSALMSTHISSRQSSDVSSKQSSNGEKDMDREEMTVNYSRSDLKTSEASDDFQNIFQMKLTDALTQLDSCIDENIKNKLLEGLMHIYLDEITRMRLENDTEIKEIENQNAHDKQAYCVEIRHLRELLASVKAGNADIDTLRKELNIKHEKEMENLRTYFEKKCSDMERSYSEEVWRGRTEAASALGSSSSLDAWFTDQPAAGDFIRRRTRSADIQTIQKQESQKNKKYEQQLEDIKSEHVAYINDLQVRHREEVVALEEQIVQLKAHLQTAENTEQVYQQDIDLELEKRVGERVERARREAAEHLQAQIQVLLSDPDAEPASWPVELVALRDKIHDAAARGLHYEVPAVRDDQSPDADKWKQRRNHSFDQNRHLEEITKERDSFKRVACTLQRVVTQLVAYCAAAEDELNKTVLTELLAHVLPAETLSGDEESRPSTPNTGSDLNTSLIIRSGSKHVHFAPDLRTILSVLDEGTELQFQQQKDLSLEIKNELETSLMRLRAEAQDILELSAKVAKNRTHKPSLEKTPANNDQIVITELVNDLDNRQKSCDNCELHRKNMEEAMAECVQREGLLRSELETAMLRIASLMHDEQNNADVIAEGYGTLQHPRAPLSLPIRPPPRTPPPLDSRSASVDGSNSPRADLARLFNELDAAQRERDDLSQQLEAANRQLRSTRQFVEEQAAERETERDDFARQLRDLREENARLAQRLQSNARILSEMNCLRQTACHCRAHSAQVEQLESQTKEMNQIIAELESRKSVTDEELKASSEKVSLLRDIVSNLESQLEQKTVHEAQILEQLEEMKRTIDDRDSKMRNLLGELESLRSERNELTSVTCLHCASATNDEEDGVALVTKIKEQAQWLEECLHRRTQKLERIHESVCSTSCSEPSEDVSLKDHKKPSTETNTESPEPRRERLPLLAGVWECLDAHARAEDAAIKRVADLEMQRVQLKDIAQEVRAERDVLQTRMSEQALRVSTLQARLERQRDEAETARRDATSELLVKLHDATSEVQRLKEELDVKEKQMMRLRKSIDERDKLSEEHASLYGNSCHPKDKVLILERELSEAQTKIAQLETIAKSLEAEKDSLQQLVRDNQRQLAERNAQLQELLALKLDEDNQRTEQKSDNVDGCKNSARTLSDIVSISDYDEQDLQMRRAEVKSQNMNVSGILHQTEREKSFLHQTLLHDHDKPNVSSLNLDYMPKHLETTPRADSLPTHLTSTQNKDIDIIKMFKRNVNETTIFGSVPPFGDSVKHSTVNKIPDNCSMFPNRDISDSKDVSVEPKRIDFSLEPSNIDHQSDREEPDFTSLTELGIVIDFKQQNFPDIFSQLKNEIKKSRNELESCRSKLKHAEEQLCEFPALKEEVEELKNLLENTMSTMKNDKQFYEKQLENFTSNKKILDQRLTDLTQEVNDKSKDLHLLKEDILRRENMILELAKEKRNLTNKMAELEVKIDELQSRISLLQKYESENAQMKEKLGEIQKLQHVVSEKNQQIDSLNQHLDRLDDLQRRLDDKTEQLENLKEAFEEKSNELFQLQDTVESLTRDLNNITNENSKLVIDNRELKQILTKLEKEQDNTSLRLQNSENEVEKLNSMNSDLSKKLEDMKSLTDQLKDKEYEIEMLNEDIKNFHGEISTLKEQLKMVSRSPSPRGSKSGEEGTPKNKQTDRQANDDKKQLIKIRKQISVLQHELDFNKKDLNEKAFELARAKLDVTELKNMLNQATTKVSDKEICIVELTTENNTLRTEIQQMTVEKEKIREQLTSVMSRIREEGSLKELKEKLKAKDEQCQALEEELKVLKDMFEKMNESPQRHRAIQSTEEQDLALVIRSGNRSPTTELENAVRAQLNYSNQLDDSIMEQILSSSSDVEEVPRLALNTSKSSSSIHSSSSEKIGRLRSENEKLQMQVNNLEARLKDKDALIAELNRIRDKLVQDWQKAKLLYEAERDNAGRLQLLLDTHKDTAESLQNQDSNMIQILKKRLESAMASETQLQQGLQHQRARCSQLERELLRLADSGGDSVQAVTQQLYNEMETNERLKGDIALLKSKLECEKNRYIDLQTLIDQNKLHFQREIESRNEQNTTLKLELAELKRLKHDASVELLKARELIDAQHNTIAALEKRSSNEGRKPLTDALTEFEEHKTDLAREIANLKKCLESTATDRNSELVQKLKDERAVLTDRVQSLEQELLAAKNKANTNTTDDKDQAVRYLHSRCLRLESCRKALVWQKRYLQKALSGYAELERTLNLPPSGAIGTKGKKKFKCAALVVVATVRMAFLVRRRLHVRTLSARCLFPNALHHDGTRYTEFSPGPPAGGGSTPHHTPSYRLFRTRGPPAVSGLLHSPASHFHDSRRSSTPLASASAGSTPRQEPAYSAHGSCAEPGAVFVRRLDHVGQRLQRVLASPRDTH